MSKGFQNGISQFQKKIRPSSPISFHNYGNLKKVCKTLFFHVDAIALAAYAKKFLPRGKAAVCCILLRGIVWTHLYIDLKKQKNFDSSHPPPIFRRQLGDHPSIRQLFRLVDVG